MATEYKPRWKKCPKCDEGWMQAMVAWKSGADKRCRAIWSCGNCGHTEPRNEIWSKTKRNRVAAKLCRIYREANSKGNDDWWLEIKHELEELDICPTN